MRPTLTSGSNYLLPINDSWPKYFEGAGRGQLTSNFIQVGQALTKRRLQTLGWNDSRWPELKSCLSALNNAQFSHNLLPSLLPIFQYFREFSTFWLRPVKCMQIDHVYHLQRLKIFAFMLFLWRKRNQFHSLKFSPSFLRLEKKNLRKFSISDVGWFSA